MGDEEKNFFLMCVPSRNHQESQTTAALVTWGCTVACHQGQRGQWSRGFLASNFVFPEFSVLRFAFITVQ